MRTAWIAAAALACLMAAPAQAQPTEQTPQSIRDGEQLRDQIQERLNAAPNPALQPVDTLTCDQMFAEMFTAGQQMSGQLDPSFGANVQDMRDDMDRQRNAAMGQSAGTMAACMIPGMGMACMAAQQAQAARGAAQAEQNRQQMNTITGQVLDSTQGIDLGRMQAVGDRWSQQNCQPPEGAPPMQ